MIPKTGSVVGCAAAVVGPLPLKSVLISSFDADPLGRNTDDLNGVTHDRYHRSSVTKQCWCEKNVQVGNRWSNAAGHSRISCEIDSIDLIPG